MKPFLLVLSGMIAALGLAIFYIIWTLDPPINDIRLLLLFMSGSGAITLLATYILYRLGMVRLFPGLRWALLSIVILTVLLIFANVWVTAQLMFISNHDLVLTTALLVFAGLTALAFGLLVADTLSARIQMLSSAAED